MPTDTELVALDGRYGSWRRLALPGLTTAASAENTFGPSRYPAYTYALSPSGTLFTHSYVAAGASLRVLSTRQSGRGGHARPGGRLALALAISQDGRWIASEDASGIHVSRVTRAGQAAAAPRSYPGAEPIFSTSLGFCRAQRLSRLVSGLWGTSSRCGTSASTHASGGRSGFPCPGGAAGSARGRGWRIQPGGRAGPRSSDSNGDLLLRAGLGSSFGTVTTLARGGTEEFGLPLWSRTGDRLYVFGRTLSVVTAGGKGRVVMVRKTPDLPQDLALSADGRRLFAVDAAGTIRIGPVPSGAVGPSAVRSAGPVCRLGLPARPAGAGPARPARAAGRSPGAAVIHGPPGIRPNAGLYQRQAAVSPDGTRAAVIDQSDQEVFVVNLTTRRIWRVPGVRAYELAYSGPRLILQRENGDIDLRTTDGTRVIRSVQTGTPWNYGNIAVSPGPAGQFLLAGERADGRGIVADLGSGHLLGVFPIAKASPYQQTTMAFTSGGRSLVTVTEGNGHSDNGVLTQLSLVPAQWIKVACTTSGHNLTPGTGAATSSATPLLPAGVCPVTRQLPWSRPTGPGGRSGSTRRDCRPASPGWDVPGDPPGSLG